MKKKSRMVDLQIVAITTFIHTLLDAIKLYKILDEVFTPADVLMDMLMNSKKILIMLVKAIDCKKLIEGKRTCRKENRKTDKIIESWENGNGIVILRLSAETTHYEAHAREYAVIKSVGITNIATLGATD